MTRWWLLHGVGAADVGVSSDRDNTDQARYQERRRALHEITDPALLRDRLVRLCWDGPVTGQLSPLAGATHALPTSDPVRLVLVATPTTRSLADALVAALNRVPDAFGPTLAVTVAQVEGTAASGGLVEDEVTTALAPHLRDADEDDRVLITWGSGSTQVAFGSVEAAIRARLRWLFVNVGSPSPAERYVLLNPSDGLDDPLVPLLLRWRYHDLLADLIREGRVTVPDELQQAVLTGREHWQEAYLRPTADNLHRLMADALMRGDATSGFAVRAYIPLQYRQLRDREDPPPLDLIAWAERKRGRRPLGKLLGLIRREEIDQEVHRAKNTASGQWLLGDTVEILNEAGKEASHELTPPPAALRRSLREHLATVPTDQPLMPDPVQLLPAMDAWYVTIVGKGSILDHPPRLHPLQLVAKAATEWKAADPDPAACKAVEDRADPEVARYLGVQNPTEVDRHYLILGTSQGSEHDAVELARRVNAFCTADVAMVDIVPDPAAAPLFDTAAAYALLRGHFQRVRTDVGAMVLVPTGPKPHVLALFMAALRLAAQEGIPLFLRQLISGPMHLLPVRFGADHLLLGLARHALNILELNVAVRLLHSCSAGRDLALRTDQLRNAWRCDNPYDSEHWPGVFPSSWSRRNRATGLVCQRVQTWADLAGAYREPAHGMRAVMGACAVLERSIRTAQPPQGDEKEQGDDAWASFQQQTRQRAHGDNHARVLRTLFQVRNKLPISHGAGDVEKLDVLIGRELGSSSPVGAAELLGLVVIALRRWFGDVSAGIGIPSLSALLDELRADVRKAEDAEQARLARSQAGILRTRADLIDLLGTLAVEAVASCEPEA